ncbi:MAG TPA: SpoIIE family protein phosphatase [Mycobacteriales bacterium]|nr:SpoIIE family protein phosphatase [Mycobacteriales bacterium]
MTHADLDAYLSAELLEQLGDAVTVIGPDWRYRFVSQRAAVIIGRSSDELVGEHVWEVFPDVVGTPQHEACLRAMTARTAERLVWYFETVGRWYAQHAIPAGDGLLILVDDVTDQHRAERRAEQLVEVGEELARATTLEELNATFVGRIFPIVGAAGGTIVLADEAHGVLRALGWEGMDAEVRSAWREFSIDSPVPSAEAYRSGAPVLVDDVATQADRYPEIATIMARLGRNAIAAVPLMSANVRLGAVTATFLGDHSLDAGDTQFFVTAAAMTAQALLRLRLLEAERETIASLQRSLLPNAVPAVDGIEIAVRYVPAEATNNVGGDWYDVVRLAAGAVGIVMGDVEGHDLNAAALMGLVRSAVRAYALEGQPPAVIISQTNTFLASLDHDRIVTICYAQLHPLERLITVVSAGHPGIQVVVGPDCEPFEVPSDIGPPLGVFDSGRHWPETTSTLPPKCTIATFTDGLVEKRYEDITEGLERVRGTLMTHCGDEPEMIADALLLERGEGGYDDVALLVGRLNGDPDQSRQLTRRLPPTPASVFLARRFASQLFREWDVAAEIVQAAELVVSELVTNAARHSEDALEVRLSCSQEVLRIEVVDSSHRTPAELPLMEDIAAEATGGRGLPLVAAMSTRWGVDSDGLSNRVWAEFDLP